MGIGVGNAPGRGRKIHQQDWRMSSMRRSISRKAAGPAIATNYFWPATYVGTKSLTFEMVSDPTVAGDQGAYFYIPTIPGRQYTASAYVLLTASSTVQASVSAGIMNVNPYFDAGTTDWTPTNASIAASPFEHTGTQSMLITPSGAGQPDARCGLSFGAASTQYVVSAWVYSPNGWADVRPIMDSFTSAGVFVSTQLGSTIPVAAGQWTKISQTLTSAATAGQVRMRVLMMGSPTTNDILYADECTMVPADGTIDGTATSTPLSWQRISVTFTATSTMHNFSVHTTGAVVSGQVYIDALQHEQGAVTTPWTAYGPTIFGVFGGYVERWPSSWNYQGTYGLAQITGVDAFAPMAGQNLKTEFINSVLAKNPDYYWPLSEPSGAVSFAEQSGNQGPLLTRFDAPNGPATAFDAGTANDIVGDPSGSGLSDHTDVTMTFPVLSSPVQIGMSNLVAAVPGFTVGSATYPVAITLSFYMSHTALPALYTGYGLTITDGTEAQLIFTVGGFNNPSPTIGAVFAQSRTGGNGSTTIADQWADGKPHHYLATLAIDATNITVELFVDGNSQGQNVSSSAALLQPLTATILQAAGFVDRIGVVGSFPAMPDAVTSHVAVWNRILSFEEIFDLTVAGQSGYDNELSNFRVDRYLSYHYIAQLAAENGASQLGISNLSADTALLDAVQAVTTSENGYTFVDPRGIITFQARTHRYLETSAKWVFGERAELGEIPYLGDIAFDYDPTQVYNDVTVTNSGGAAPNVSNVDSQKRYGKRSYSRQVNLETDLEATDAANWILSSHLDPVQRVESLTVDAASNPALWSQALAIRISDRVTVYRRTPAFDIAADFFIERIEHSRAPGQWKIIFQMSPAALARQPWILENAAFGILDLTTVLGY